MINHDVGGLDWDGADLPRPILEKGREEHEEASQVERESHDRTPLSLTVLRIFSWSDKGQDFVHLEEDQVTRFSFFLLRGISLAADGIK